MDTRHKTIKPIRQIVLLASVFGVTLAIVSLLLWTQLGQALGLEPPMTVTGSLGFFLASLALLHLRPQLSHTQRKRSVVLSISVLCVVVAGLFMLFRSSGKFWHWEMIKQHAFSLPADLSAGAIHLGTAVSLLIFSLSLCLVQTRQKWAAFLGRGLFSVGALLSLFFILEDIYFITYFRSYWPTSPIPLVSALGFLLLYAGGLFAWPRFGWVYAFSSDTASGKLARRIFIPALVLPILFVGLLFEGMRLAYLSAPVALTLACAGIVFIFAVLVFWYSDVQLRLEDQRLHMLNSVKQAEEKFRLVASGLPIAFFTFDSEGYITFADGKGLKMIGVDPPSRNVGLSLFDLYGHNSKIISDIERTLNGEELTALAFEGSEWWETRFAPDYDEDGRVVGGLGVSMVVSDLVKAKDELAHQAEELRRSNQDLEQFAQIASHDLQEPLRTITGYVQLFERRYKDKVDEKGQRYIEHIVRGTMGMQELIEDILTYSRLRQDDLQLEPTDTELILIRVLQDCRAAIEEARVQVYVSALPIIKAKPSLIHQLLLNLINNAVKFRREEPLVVKVAAEYRDNGWLFLVEDNGIGISPEYFEKVFKAFQRLHPRHRFGGTGVGLAICKRVIELLNGKIWVESKEGEGSQFYFWLPADPDLREQNAARRDQISLSQLRKFNSSEAAPGS